MNEINTWAARRAANAELGDELFAQPEMQKELRFEKHGNVIFDKAEAVDLAYYFPSAVGSAFFYYGRFEAGEIALCRQLLEGLKEPVVVDVGANIGSHSIAWANQVPGAHIYAFEPAPANLELLRRNVVAQGLENRITVVGSALDSKSGKAQFFETDDAAYSSLRDTKRRPVKQSYDVPVTTLDEFVAGNAIKSLALLKIDVEGTEDNILAGAQETLKRFKPMLFIEIYGGENSNPDPQRTISTLLQAGYTPFVISDGYATPFEAHDDRFYNYLFVHRSSKAKLPPADLRLVRSIESERLELLDKLTADLQKSHAELLNARREWEKLDAAVAEKDRHLQDVGESARNLRQQLQAAAEESRSLGSSANALRKQLDAANEENRELSKTAANLRKQLEAACKESRSLTESTKELREQLNAANAETANLTQSAAQLREQLNASNDESKQLNDAATVLRDQLKASASENASLTKKADALRAQLLTSSEAADALRAQLRASSEANLHLSDAAKALQKQLEEKDRAIADLSQSANDLRKQLEVAGRDAASKDREIGTLSGAANDLRAQLGEKDALIVRLSNELSQLSQELAAAYAQVQEKDGALAAQQAETDMLRSAAEERLAMINDLNEVSMERLSVIQALNEHLTRLQN